jgi:hypothetical protein
MKKLVKVVIDMGEAVAKAYLSALLFGPTKKSY